MELKIIRLARRRMLITSKRPKPRPIVPLKKRPRVRLGTSHRRPK